MARKTKRSRRKTSRRSPKRRKSRSTRRKSPYSKKYQKQLDRGRAGVKKLSASKRASLRNKFIKILKLACVEKIHHIT